MKQARIFFRGLAVVACIVIALLTSNCGKTKCDDDVSCSACRMAQITDNGKNEICECVPNPDSICPENVVNGYYDYGLCLCLCKTGWKGANCDQRDTAYFIRFRHGADTAALSSVLGTHDVTFVAPDSVFQGVFPAGSAFDSIVLVDFPFIKDTFPLCGWGCAYLQVYLTGGETMYSVSGEMIVDSFVSKVYASGTFSSKLYAPANGNTYYIREGVFALPLK